jgi:hypothetical protein
MWKKGWERFLQLTGGADKVGIWWTVFGPSGVLVTLYAPVLNAFDPIAKNGWAAVVLSSIILTLVTMVVISLLLISLRYFRPLANLADVNIPPARENASISNAERPDIMSLNLDLISLLHFATDETTLYLIDDLIKNAPDSAISSAPAEKLARIRYEDAQKFLRRISNSFQNEHRAMDINAILAFASNQAEGYLRQTQPNERPSHIDPIDLPKYLIAEFQCKEVMNYLIKARDEKREVLAGQRSQLADRLSQRRAS